MRIISKFRDYYDCVQGKGVDNTLVYHRVCEEQLNAELPGSIVDIFRSLPSRSYPGFRGIDGYSAEKYLIGFCGKLYPVYSFTDCPYHGNCKGSRKLDTYNTAYSLEDIIKYLKDNKLIGGLEDFERKTKRETRSSCINPPFTKQGISSLEWEVSHSELFTTLKQPVFLIKRNNHDRFRKLDLIVNPCLTNFGFYRKIDSYTAYQELSMYISGVLGVNENPTIDISDTDMRDAKGFDKWSFKRLPSKKKR